MKQIGTILIESQKGSRRTIEVHHVFDAGLLNNAFLHRFLNCADTEYSAIYQNSGEIWSCERSYEENMLKAWNEEDSLEDITLPF